MVQFYRTLAGAYGRLGLVTKVAFVAGAVLVTTALGIVVVLSLPVDHFRADKPAPRRNPVLHAAVLALRNLLGAIILPLGIVMALPLVPGPGLVFIAIGLSLLDFPGKRRLERRLLARPGVRRFLNEVRHRFGRAPLSFEST